MLSAHEHDDYPVAEREVYPNPKLSFKLIVDTQNHYITLGWASK